MKGYFRHSKSIPKILPVILSLFITCAHFLQTTARTNDSREHESSVLQGVPNLQKGMYVIIGAFGVVGNAQDYTTRVKGMGYDAQLARSPINGLYYVYVYYTPDDLTHARQIRGQMRSTAEFHDAWIMYFQIDMPADEEIEFTPLQTAPIAEMEEVAIEEAAEEEAVAPPVEKIDAYPYLFNVINATNLKEVPGFIQIIDAERNKQYQTVSTNKIEFVEDPDTQTKRIIALCDIFGYVKQQVEMVLDDPLANPNPMVTKDGKTTVVRFNLQRHNKGDILTMYNVYFYNDAAIMKPESQFELNSLLDMLKENENYEIKLHGHTNGNSPGKIIRLGEEDDNFFEVTGDNIEDYGSAKKLSLERADVIMRWLESKGINKKRMSVKGWGGKKMLYSKNEALAKRNIRVEVEILKE